MSTVFVYILTLSVIRSPSDHIVKLGIAQAIEAVTDDPHERRLLASIALWESNFRYDVATCGKLGPQGERGAWQILPRSDSERKQLCVSYVDDARIALERIRESLTVCRHNPASERLSLYARGSCTSVEGRRLSRNRWVP